MLIRTAKSTPHASERLARAARQPYPRFEPAGISTLGHQPSQENALDYVLGALKALAPQILESLRDAEGESAELAASWARQHHLDAAFVIEHMAQQRDHWLKYQRYGQVLAFGGISYSTIVVPSDHDTEWVQQQTHQFNLPDPGHETLGAWLVRARQLYHERGALRKKKQPTPRWDDFARHCDWFVQLQVLGCRPSEIAAGAKQAGINKSDRAAIERATDRIATLLGVQRRRWRAGRRANCDY